MPLEPSADLRASASTLVEALFGQARATAGHAQEGKVTYVGDADGALEVTVAGGSPTASSPARWRPCGSGTPSSCGP